MKCIKVSRSGFDIGLDALAIIFSCTTAVLQFLHMKVSFL
ncbi:hypothetical protein Cyrtocomes_00855 [Candidatus Cyrtobacter comes]|uniref:Uncharacterized protein n=1 Tax=Candidatus Cyrtobacter comes TaxID=675776 RepID=A0ABU5L8M0_9RICK|nr:hypothetical protein [Candidatus Cyrtobacter comes]